MNIKPIRNEVDLQAAFKRLEVVYQAQEGTPESDEMEILVTLIESYENKYFPMGVADPVEAIKFRMEQQGLTQKDLEPFIGSSGRGCKKFCVNGHLVGNCRHFERSCNDRSKSITERPDRQPACRL
ncbi:MAG: hypothetical protein WC736_16385, partial [Gallionella sp.]